MQDAFTGQPSLIRGPILPDPAGRTALQHHHERRLAALARLGTAAAECGLRADSDRDLVLLAEDEVSLLEATGGVWAALGEAIRTHYGVAPQIARTAREWRGLRNAYREPERLGVDRWLAMVAVWHDRHGKACVVDAGTALTADVIADDGCHRGGFIAGGLATQQIAVLGATRFATRDQEARYDGGLGNDTESCVRQGAMLACLGAIDRAAQRDLRRCRIQHRERGIGAQRQRPVVGLRTAGAHRRAVQPCVAVHRQARQRRRRAHGIREGNTAARGQRQRVRPIHPSETERARAHVDRERAVQGRGRADRDRAARGRRGHDRSAGIADDQRIRASARYRVGPGIIEHVIAQVIARRTHEQAHGAAGGGAALADDDDAAPLLEEVARQHIASRLSHIATHVKRLAKWEQVSLPDDAIDSVREFIARIRHRKTVYERWGFDSKMTTSRGLTALFYGPPGTGKSMVAGLIAKLVVGGPNEPRGFILTTILGIVGAVVATYLGQALHWYAPGEGAGFIGAIVGAIIVATYVLLAILAPILVGLHVLNPYTTHQNLINDQGLPTAAGGKFAGRMSFSLVSNSGNTSRSRNV